ncbi:putative cytochrome c oxidase subunit [Cardiosporidium cionae]|uniref:Cytochrome c oxidase subunit n=1 Tax=Cardiosporidium cionae TaxID=476202 RepID=A0ABQ7JFX6_9APIC|nr:putative cytochrome c oxidase subunit [Cardiosporidium cionae]|eukprot:KAF8822882.1 putative cytochrome c oxidase subunit [Cardiosporidium cionae]
MALSSILRHPSFMQSYFPFSKTGLLSTPRGNGILLKFLKEPAKSALPSIMSLRRTYLHFVRALPDDYELPVDTMPKNVENWMKKDPKQMDFFENYWYWRIRGEATLLNPESLPKKSYAQLARDLGLQLVREESEHMVGVLELYEYLKSSPFIGPFGTIEKPVLVPSVHTERIVGCTGGTGDNEHIPLWFRCREGFLYRCGECDQIFMLVKVAYSLAEGEDPFPVDPDLDDVFDLRLIESGQKMWNLNEYVTWPVGNEAYVRLFKEGKQSEEATKSISNSADSQVTKQKVPFIP